MSEIPDETPKRCEGVRDLFSNRHAIGNRTENAAPPRMLRATEMRP